MGSRRRSARRGSVSVAKLAVRGDRIVAKTTLVRQQRDMARVAHQAIRQYLAVVRRAVAHTAVTAAAPTMIAPHTAPVEAPPEDESDLGADVDLNALDQSAAWPGILRATILPAIDDLTGGIGPTGLMTPTVASTVNAWRAQWLDARTQALVGVPDQITKQIRDAIQADADQNGPNPRAAASIVKDLLNPDAPTWASRADTIARTEVVSANNQGGLASWTAIHQSLGASGGKVYKTWLATEDRTTREDHANIDGTEIGVDENFDVGGNQMSGPGDGPADEVINCRCTLTFRVEGGSAAGDSLDEAAAAADAGGDDGGDAMTAAVEAPVTAPAKTADAPDSSAPYQPQPYAPEPDETVTCPSCQKMNDTDAVYCDQCGFELKGATGVVVAPPVAEDGSPVTAAAPMPPPMPPQPADGTPSEAAPAAPPGAMTWSGVLATLDTPSSDGRMIQSAGLVIRPLPLPLSYQQHGEHGGEEAGKTVIVGRILTASIEGGQLVGTGDFLDVMSCYEAMAALEQVAAGIGGVSIDLPVQVVSYMAPGPGGTLLPVDPMQYLGDPDTIIQVAEQSELAGACIVNTPAFAAARIELVAAESAVPSLTPVVADAATPVGPVLTDDSITFPDGTVLHVGDSVNIVDADNPAITSGLIETIDPSTNAVTVAVEDPNQPGQTNSITVDASSLSVTDPDAEEPPASGGTGTPDGVTAAAFTFPGLEEEHVYPADWFDPVQLDGPTRMTITDDGRVYGHLAQSGSCHMGFADKCVTPPESPSNYAYFHMGEIKTDKGLLAAGKITVGGGHADIRLGWRAAIERYDNVATVGAVVRAYRDEHGIQLAGALLPNATKEQIAAMRRSPLSGDWRIIGGQRELVVAHCVNDPGFPIAPRAALAADGHPTALVAAGIVYGPPMADEPTPGGITLPSGVKLTDADVAVLASAFADVTDQRNQEALDREQRAADARNLRRSLLRNKLRVV